VQFRTLALCEAGVQESALMKPAPTLMVTLWLPCPRVAVMTKDVPPVPGAVTEKLPVDAPAGTATEAGNELPASDDARPTFAPAAPAGDESVTVQPVEAPGLSVVEAQVSDVSVGAATSTTVVVMVELP